MDNLLQCVLPFCTSQLEMLLLVIVDSSSTPLEKLILNPVLVVADFDVDARNVELPTADTPRHDPGQLPQSVHLADQGAAAVALYD